MSDEFENEEKCFLETPIIVASLQFYKKWQNTGKGLLFKQLTEHYLLDPYQIRVSCNNILPWAQYDGPESHLLAIIHF